MNRLDTMTGFEILHRVKTLAILRNGIIGYYKQTDRGAVAEINSVLLVAKESMSFVGVNPMVRWPERSIYLLDNLFDLHEWNVDPNVLLDMIDQTIGKYRLSLSSAWFRMLLPSFWITRFFVRTIPSIGNSRTGKVGLSFSGVLANVALVVGILHNLGLADVFKRLLHIVNK